MQKMTDCAGAAKFETTKEYEGGINRYQANKPPKTVERMPGHNPPNHAAITIAG